MGDRSCDNSGYGNQPHYPSQKIPFGMTANQARQMEVYINGMDIGLWNAPVCSIRYRDDSEKTCQAILNEHEMNKACSQGDSRAIHAGQGAYPYNGYLPARGHYLAKGEWNEDFTQFSFFSKRCEETINSSI